ncbi:hypothetical protein BUALT_Bualt07G0008500 [Buddleja alternifolia]|uniref:Homeobox-leucine zipper protein n=1 Tax=Buddleja alternifolia TaxID=168488 RepID=A0AAV6XDU2_9LAMI|nr:hypothetical protein BUALT_Bualt07G0008500 [Buddleja alternifolia]
MAKRFEKYQIESLKMAFEESEHLTKEKKIELVRLTGLDMEQIASWYNRRRARKRAKESRGELERINKDLKQSLRERHEYEAKLQKELRDSKKREAELQDENQCLKRQLTIVEDHMAKRFEKHQIEALKSAFEESETLTREKKIELVAATGGLDMEQISTWFNRMRARKRALEQEERRRG